MIKKWKEAGALFPLEDCVTLWKLVIASYVGFLLVWAFGFNATSSISVSAIMTLPYGSTVTNTRSYVRKRMLAQIIGVMVAYPLYLFFRWLPYLHDSQRMALPMTISLILTALINRGFHLKIADITMLIPGYLVILMTPGYDLYPIMRPIYVLLGILLGYALNVWFFAPNYGKIIDQQLERAGALLEPMMSEYDGGELTQAQRASLQEAASCLNVAETALPLLKQDLHRCKKYESYIPRLPYLEQRLTADQAVVLLLLESIPQGEDAFAQGYRQALQALFDSHQQLLHGQTPQKKEIICPASARPSHAAPLARLVHYMETLFCADIPVIPM